MDKENFRVYLKRRGKQPNVVEGLLGQVERFEGYLAGKNGNLESAKPKDILDYAAQLESQAKGSARKGVRGLALYFHFAGMPQLSETASNLREQTIAQTRASFPLRDFLGVRPEVIAALDAVGIVNIDHMLSAAATPRSRKELAAQTNVPLKAILELVKLSDLARIDGVKAIRARLYFDAGVDTVEKMAAQEPEELLRLTAEFVKRTGFTGIAPLPKEVLHTIETARKLPKVVEYSKGEK